MKILPKLLLILVLFIIVLPIFSVFYYSFLNTENDSIYWYKEILQDEGFINSLLLSIKISTVVAIITTLFGFFISLSWFNKKQRNIVILLFIILGLLPPDIIALSISQLSQFLNITNSNLFFTVIGLVFYTLPFTILLLWARYYFIDNAIIRSARDIGMKNLSIIIKIIFGMSLSTIFSSLLFSFILALNEYPRTYYLSGSYNFISEYLYSKLKSGANESIYAGSSLTVILSVLLLIMITFLFYKKNSKGYKI